MDVATKWVLIDPIAAPKVTAGEFASNRRELVVALATLPPEAFRYVASALEGLGGAGVVREAASREALQRIGWLAEAYRKT